MEVFMQVLQKELFKKRRWNASSGCSQNSLFLTVLFRTRLVNFQKHVCCTVLSKKRIWSYDPIKNDVNILKESSLKLYRFWVLSETLKNSAQNSITNFIRKLSLKLGHNLAGNLFICFFFFNWNKGFLNE